MTIDPTSRLGGNGEDVKLHPWFDDIQWDQVTSTEAAFIPQVTDPESTDYFDPRGAIPQLFHDDEIANDDTGTLSEVSFDKSMPPPPVPPLGSIGLGSRDATGSQSSDDFGSFSFKNLPVLKQHNDDVIRKIKSDQMAPLTHAMSESTGLHGRKRSMSQRFKKPTLDTDTKQVSTNPPSPSASTTSSVASSPSRASIPVTGSSGGHGHSRKPSEYGTVERFKHNHMEGVERRNSLPSRLRTSSVSSVGDGSGSENWNSSHGHGSGSGHTPPSSVHSIDLKRHPDPSDRAVTCLLAEDNPITAKIIETLLIRLGCRCVVVSDGSEAISVAMGDISKRLRCLIDCCLTHSWQSSTAF